MSAFNDLTDERLRTLAQTRADEQTVISLYLDLDPARFATAAARETEIVSLLDRAHREIEEAERSHSELAALRAGLGRAREVLLGEDRSWAQGARSIVLYVCEPLGLQQLLRLPESLESAVVVADAPFIAPLAQAAARRAVCASRSSTSAMRASCAAPRSACARRSPSGTTSTAATTREAGRKPVTSVPSRKTSRATFVM